jgi:hypothetical protein
MASVDRPRRPFRSVTRILSLFISPTGPPMQNEARQRPLTTTVCIETSAVTTTTDLKGSVGAVVVL